MELLQAKQESLNKMYHFLFQSGVELEKIYNLEIEVKTLVQNDLNVLLSFNSPEEIIQTIDSNISKIDKNLFYDTTDINKSRVFISYLDQLQYALSTTSIYLRELISSKNVDKVAVNQN